MERVCRPQYQKMIRSLLLHEKRGRAVLHLPQADQEAAGAGLEESVGETDIPLAGHIAPQSRFTCGERHKIRIEFPVPGDRTGRDAAGDLERGTGLRAPGRPATPRPSMW
jgi:hypothetical protein